MSPDRNCPKDRVMDPFTAVPTLVVICNVKDPVTGKWYTRDPRYIAQKAEAHLKNQAAAGRPLDRAGQSREEPRLATQGRRVYAGRHRDVDRIQAEARSRRGAAPPAPLVVRALLRYLIVIRGERRRSTRDRLVPPRSEEHTSELQSLRHLVCRLLLE